LHERNYATSFLVQLHLAAELQSGHLEWISQALHRKKMQTGRNCS